MLYYLLLSKFDTKGDCAMPEKKINLDIIAKGEAMADLLHVWERMERGVIPQTMAPYLKKAILELSDDIARLVGWDPEEDT